MEVSRRREPRVPNFLRLQRNGEGKGADAFSGMKSGGNPLLLLSFGRIWSRLEVVRDERVFDIFGAKGPIFILFLRATCSQMPLMVLETDGPPFSLLIRGVGYKNAIDK